MKKQNDSGFPVNVANLATLISLVGTFGKKYNPAKFSIKLENLIALFNRIKEVLKAVDRAEKDLSDTQKMRERVFYQLEGFVTRIVGAVGSTDILPEKVEKIASLVRKFRGKKATPSSKPDTPATPDAPSAGDVKTNSTAQLSFDRKEDNFSELVTFLKGDPNYITNELDLKVEALDAMVSELEARNAAVRTTRAAYTSALIARDKLFFGPDGLVRCGNATKKYVQSAFTATSPEFNSVSGIAFTSRNKE